MMRFPGRTKQPGCAFICIKIKNESLVDIYYTSVSLTNSNYLSNLCKHFISKTYEICMTIWSHLSRLYGERLCKY